VKTPKSKLSKTLPAGRIAPHISPDLPPITAASEIFSKADIEVRDCVLENFDFQGLSPESIVLENCILKRINFTRSKLARFKMKDVRLVECDFANAEATALKLIRSSAIASSNQRNLIPAILVKQTFKAPIFAAPF
jgi:uncharacterized protein YjbI with pentapeptide repeats